MDQNTHTENTHFQTEPFSHTHTKNKELVHLKKNSYTCITTHKDTHIKKSYTQKYALTNIHSETHINTQEQREVQTETDMKIHKKHTHTYKLEREGEKEKEGEQTRQIVLHVYVLRYS